MQLYLCADCTLFVPKAVYDEQHTDLPFFSNTKIEKLFNLDHAGYHIGDRVSKSQIVDSNICSTVISSSIATLLTVL